MSVFCNKHFSAASLVGYLQGYTLAIKIFKGIGEN